MTFKHTFSALVFGVAFSLPINALAEDAPDATTVVATVNGTEITLGHMIVLKQRLPEQYQQLEPSVLFEGILDQLVQQTLLGDTVDQLSLGTRMTLDNEERALRANEAMQGLAKEAMTDEALQSAYDQTFGTADPETEYNASHILVDTEDEAKALVTELEGGADFAELAKEKSTGPSGPRGGELGWFGQGAMVPPFEAAVMALESGSISSPVQTQFGWHVIKLNEVRQANAPSLEEVRGELSDQIQRTAIETRVAELTLGADVSRLTAGEVDPTLLNDLSLLEN